MGFGKADSVLSPKNNPDFDHNIYGTGRLDKPKKGDKKVYSYKYDQMCRHFVIYYNEESIAWFWYEANAIEYCEMKNG